MKLNSRHRLLHISGLLLSALVWLANSGNPTNARTGAPFDGHCNSCHNGNNPNNYAGTIDVTGLSSPITPNTVYPLTVTMTTTGAGIPARGGFQMVAVDGTGANCGDFTTITGQGTGTEFAAGREYIEHRNPKNFSGAGSSITWNLNWKSPATAAGNTVKLYFIGNFCNGSTDQNDFPTADNATYTFQAPAAIEASITNITSVLCFGQANGNATVTATGGNGVYTYAWSNGQTGQTVNNVAAGTYTVTVTDTGGGTATAVASVTQPASALNGTTQVSNVITCINQSATITASGTGGTPPYVYVWANGTVGNTNEVTAAGTYVVTISDNNGCTKTVSSSVTQNTTFPAASASGSVQSCATNTATVSGQGSSSGANFSYNWTAPAGGTIISGGNSLNATVSGIGGYTLMVTNNTNGCTASAIATVTGSAAPVVTTTGTTLSCAVPSGTISASSTTPNITYGWSGPNSFTSLSPNPTVTVAGIYTVTVTVPATGCSGTATATVTGNFAVPNLAVAVTPATCAAPACVATASSTTPNVTYIWSGGVSSAAPSVTLPPGGPYTVIVTGANGCTTSSAVAYSANNTPPSLTITPGNVLTCDVLQTNIAVSSNAPNSVYVWSGPGIISGSNTATVVVNIADTYTTTVTNTANGCTASATATVTSNFTLPTVAIATPVQLNCLNPTVTLNAGASSQGAGITYLWTGPHILSGQTSLTPTVDEPGVYVLTITDNVNGCTAQGMITVFESDQVVTTISSSTDPLCFGSPTGAMTATTTGGQGAFTYVWSTNAVTAQITGLIAGTYTVTATDAEGCTSTAAATITQPSALVLTVSSTPETGQGQNDGTANANVSGGTAPYTYLWSNSTTTAAITGLAPGFYTVTASDANGCSAVQTVTVNSFNCIFSAALSATDVTCNGAANGTAMVVLTNATNPIVYQWSNLGSTQTQNNLAPGNYTVTVTDASSCTVIVSTTINEPAPVAVNATATAVTAVGANDGTATANPSGGVGPYTYMWSNGVTTQTATGLSVGNYTVTVTDANGCTNTQSAFVSAFNCAVNAVVNVTNVSCAGAGNGAAAALLVGGTAPNTYTWNTGATTAILTGLQPGVYTVSVVDANGCAASAEVTVTEPAPLVAEIAEIDNVSCLNEKTGSVVISVTGGGTTPYSFTYPGPGEQLLGVGLYTITVTNTNGCTTLAEFSIVAIDTIAPTIVCPPSVAKCDDGQVTSFDLPEAEDNCFVGNLNYELIQGLPNGTLFPVGEQVQAFKVTDQAGNSSTCSFTVSIFAAPDIALVAIGYDTNSLATGYINIAPLGGTLPYTFEWKKDNVFFSTDEDLSGLSAGTYRLVATDANGCVVVVAAFNILGVVGTTIPFSTAGIRVSPNPVDTRINLDYQAVEPAAIEIYDGVGQLVKFINNRDGFNRIDMSLLPAGMYHILLTDIHAQRYIARFVKG